MLRMESMDDTVYVYSVTHTGQLHNCTGSSIIFTSDCLFARSSCMFERSEKCSCCYMLLLYVVVICDLIWHSVFAFLRHLFFFYPFYLWLILPHICWTSHSGFANLCGGKTRGSLRPPHNFGLFCARRWGCRMNPKIFCLSVIFFQYTDETPNLKSFLFNKMIEREIETHREVDITLDV